MGLKAKINQDWQNKLTGATYMFSGMNNVLDPANLPLDKGWFPKGDNIDIDNTNSISRRKGYTSVTATSTAHSGWSNNKDAYYVDGIYLKSFNGATASIVDIVTANLRMWYAQANDVVVYSNGTESGIIGGNFSQTSVYSPDFKEITEFGTNLEFYNGRVYHAKGSSIFCTDMFDLEHSDIRHKHVATLRSKVTMIRRVEDGLCVGTETQVHFLPGDDIAEQGFSLNILADYGVVAGTDISTTGDFFPESKSKGEIVVFTTTRGICTCGASGNFINHSYNVMSIPEATDGCALVRDNFGSRQYITTLNNNIEEYNPYEAPTLTVNEV